MCFSVTSLLANSNQFIFYDITITSYSISSTTPITITVSASVDWIWNYDHIYIRLDTGGTFGSAYWSIRIYFRVYAYMYPSSKHHNSSHHNLSYCTIYHQNSLAQDNQMRNALFLLRKTRTHGTSCQTISSPFSALHSLTRRDHHTLVITFTGHIYKNNNTNDALWFRAELCQFQSLGWRTPTSISNY